MEKGVARSAAFAAIAFKVYKCSILVIKLGGISKRAALVGSLVVKTGNVAPHLGVAGGAFLGPIAWTFVGILYLTETIINYRKMKRGEITKQEFKNLTINGAVGTVGGLLGASLGAAGGFTVGSLVFPIVGSIAGTIIGGIAGGLTGKKLSQFACTKILAAV